MSHIMYAFTMFNVVCSNRFNYIFRCNEKTEILIYKEKQEEELFDEGMNENYELKFHHSSFFVNLYQEEHIFTYRKENFIKFDVFNNILSQNTSENNDVSGKIQCSYELSYFLRLTKDITELPNYFNNYQFKCMLKTLQSLKAAENNKLVLFFKALIFNHYNCGRSKKFKANNFDFEDIFLSGFMVKIDYNMKKNILFGFFSFFMIEFAFHDGNLILLENTKDFYDILLFDKKIPYKNLLINNFKIFFHLENILPNPSFLIMFHVLLNEMNIKSLIINNYQVSETHNSKFPYYILSLPIFKSIVISNITRSSIFIKYLLKSAIHGYKEYLSLKYINLSRNDLMFVLKQQKLKGLVLDNVESIENSNIFEDSIEFIEALEYIDFRNIEINYNWWKCFFKKTNAIVIILFFNTVTSQENFLDGFAENLKNMSVLKLEIYFFDFEISKDFCNSLKHFKNLQNLILLSYQTNEATEICLLRVIKGMKELKKLTIQNPRFSKTPCNYSLKNQKIEFLCIENIFSVDKTCLMDYIFNLTFITEIILTNIIIPYNFLTEIIKQKNLIKLTLKFCLIEPIKNLQKLNFSARCIKSLNVYDSNWDTLQYFDILSKLDCIEYLDLSFFNMSPSHLKNLSLCCNLNLKSLSCRSGILDIDDLKRIEKLEVLEELVLSSCIFLKSRFYQLGYNCKFFNSLTNLDLLFVDVDIEDVKYLRKFKNLKNLSLTLSGLDLLCVKSYIFSLPLHSFITNNIDHDENYKNLLRCLNEENVNNF